MVRNDPYDPDISRYECVSCGKRVTDEDEQVAECPGCGAEMRNISVPRE
jgi:predicted RNA-binding Zn-ribbon protein involved in translation (DUF1610 family)